VPLNQRGRGFGVPGIRVDGNDVLATYAVARASADSIRAGNGPLLIEAFTYRMGAHTTADDPTKYRSDAETEAWAAKDPILRLRRHLEKQGIAEGEFAAVDTEADEMAARIRAACVAMEPPAPEAMWEHVYAEPHALVDEERDAYLAYLASFEGAEETV
jgi:pyruvate dehydrogenase E1 component alpha subunit